jgi:hypothetical protein
MPWFENCTALPTFLEACVRGEIQLSLQLHRAMTGNTVSLEKRAYLMKPAHWFGGTGESNEQEA